MNGKLRLASTATLPFGYRMNYNMEYDPSHECLLLVTGGYRQQTAVWALKIRNVAAATGAGAETYEATLGVLGEAGEAEFAEKPRVEKTAQGLRIIFAVNEPTDVEVAILDARGKVVRHLAAGLLGNHAPAPFQKNSLQQELIWDGKADDGRPVEQEGCRVRVRVGLGAKLDRTIPDATGRLGPPTALGVGPDVFRFSVGVVDSAGTEIARFGRYGNVDSAGSASAVPTPAIPFGFRNAVAVAGDHVYVADRKNRRVVAVKLTHAAEQVLPIP